LSQNKLIAWQKRVAEFQAMTGRQLNYMRQTCSPPMPAHREADAVNRLV